MIFRSEIVPGGALLFAVIVTAATIADADGGVTLEGTRSATLRWTPAGGPVAGYYVVVSKNGGPLRLDGITVDSVETIEADYGDTVVVQIAAFDSDGMPGQFSPPSDEIHFAPGSGDEGGSDPADDPADKPTDESDPGLAPFDFNRDGRSDILLEDIESGELQLWEMDGLRVDAKRKLPALPANASIGGSGDYDANGVTDLLLRDDPSGRLTLWMLGDELELLDEVALDLDPTWEVAGCADFDGDGRDEIALFNFELSEMEWLGLGNGELLSLGRLPRGMGGLRLVAGIADYDGDGRADVLWTDKQGAQLDLWSMDGVHADYAGAFPGPAQDGLELVGSADHDGDGAADLLVRDPTSDRSELWSLDGARVAEITELPYGVGPNFELGGQGDYDGNGQADILWFDPQTGESIVWTLSGLDMNEGKLVVDEPFDLVALGGPLEAPGINQCLADFDGDGIVGGVDFAFLGKCFGQPGDAECAPADLNGDGVVGGLDYRLFELAYGHKDCGF